MADDPEVPPAPWQRKGQPNIVTGPPIAKVPKDPPPSKPPAKDPQTGPGRGQGPLRPDRPRNDT